MIKRILLIATIIGTISAQDGESVGWITKFGLAGGFNPTWFSQNVDEVNKLLPEFGVEKFSNSGMIGFGGSGYIYILLIDNVRIGGMGFSASQTSEGTVNSFGREAKYDLSGGAFTIEYTLPFIKTPAVSIGTMIGAGSLQIDLYQNSGEVNWNEVWDSFDEDTDVKNFSMQNNFFMISPTLNVDYPVTRYLAFRIGAGYLFTVGDSWQLNNEVTLNNVPSDLNGNSFFIQTGVYLGFFAF